MEISEGDGEVWRKASLIIGRMAQEISCAYLPAQQELSDVTYGFMGEDRQEDGVPRDSLYFISTSLPLGGRSKGLKEVGYAITADPQTGESTLLVREDSTPDDRPDEGGAKYQLAQGIVGLDFTYFDSRGQEWPRWESSTSVFGGRLPRSVKIAVLLRDARGDIITVSTRACIEVVEQ